MRTPWHLWALGVFLALLFYVGGYDNSGREPPCFGEFLSQHREAVEFRDESRGIEQTCSAIARDGHVIAVKHYPGKWEWLAVAVALVAPVSIRAIWRRFRWRGLGLAFVAVVAVTFAISDSNAQQDRLVGIARRYVASPAIAERMAGHSARSGTCAAVTKSSHHALAQEGAERRTRR